MHTRRTSSRPRASRKGPGGSPTHRPGLRQALVEAAFLVVSERGLGALQLRELARMVGVSHAAPSHHFSSRGALLTALGTEAFRALASALRDAAVASEEIAPGERLRALGIAYIAFALREKAQFAVLSQAELAHDDAELSAARREAYSVLRDAVERAQRQGWRSARDPDELCVMLWSSVHGFATLWATGQLAAVPGMSDLEGALARAGSALLDDPLGSSAQSGPEAELGA